MDIRYVAGLFDGEGCIRVDEFHIAKSPTRPKAYNRQQLKVALGMCHFPTIRALYDLFGGSLSKDMSAHKKNPKHAIRYSWGQVSGHAAEFLRQIEPFLIGKKEQAQLAIRFQQHIDELIREGHRSQPLTVETLTYRRQLIDELQRHKNGRFNIHKNQMKSPKQQWPYAAN